MHRSGTKEIAPKTSVPVSDTTFAELICFSQSYTALSVWGATVRSPQDSKTRAAGAEAACMLTSFSAVPVSFFHGAALMVAASGGEGGFPSSLFHDERCWGHSPRYPARRPAGG